MGGGHKQSAMSKCFNFIKDLNLRVSVMKSNSGVDLKSFLYQVMKTDFVPKLVATVSVCCVIYLVLVSSSKLLTVKTLASVGYFNSVVKSSKAM
jgi:hypothetical protein